MIDKKLMYWYENAKSYADGKWSQCDGKYYIYPQEKEEERIRLREQKRVGYLKNEIISNEQPWNISDPVIRGIHIQIQTSCNIYPFNL